MTHENIRPFQKAGQRKTAKNNRKRNTAILTDTPVKEALKEIKMLTEQKKGKLTFSKVCSGGQREEQRRKKVVQQSESSSSSEEYDYFCLVCFEIYSNNLPGEGWLQCSECRLWAHEACTPGRRFYTCKIYDSELAGSGM